MNQGNLLNVECQRSQLSSRPPSSSRPGSARLKTRPASAGRARGAAPIQHEPCSSTLAKFHDGVNFSLMEPRGGRQSPRHPILEAKEKYKYMSRQKSFCDESLFASNTPRQSNRHDNRYIGNHITHEYMSNQGPMTFNAPIRTNRPDSARSAVDHLDMRPKSSRIEKPYVKPWR